MVQASTIGVIWGKKSDERSLSDSSRIKCRVLFVSSHSFPVSFYEFLLYTISDPSRLSPFIFAHLHPLPFAPSLSISFPLSFPRPLQFHLRISSPPNLLTFPFSERDPLNPPKPPRGDSNDREETAKRTEWIQDLRSQRNLALFQ